MGPIQKLRAYSATIAVRIGEQLLLRAATSL